MFSKNLLSLLNNISCLYYLAERFIAVIRFSRELLTEAQASAAGGIELIEV